MKCRPRQTDKNASLSSLVLCVEKYKVLPGSTVFSHRTLYSDKVPLKHVGMFPDSATFNASQNNVLRRISLLKQISQLFMRSRWIVGSEDDIE